MDFLPEFSSLTHFRFLRPWALLALLVLPVLFVMLRHHRVQRGAWAGLVDPALQPYVLTSSLDSRKRRSGLWAYLLAALLIVALAGPTWQQLPQPVFTQQRPVVVALDLSQSMGAQDVIPSRLQVAKIKLRDILRQRRDGQTALITFAGAAFLVTPLTDDTRTIVSMLPSLTPRVMPVQGSLLEPPLEMADDLLSQAGGEAGEVILITDGVSDQAEAEDAAARLASAGHRVSVIAVGTTQGGMIKNDRGEFLRDRRGSVVMAPLNKDRLRAVARAGRGQIFDATLTEAQLDQLLTRPVGEFGAAASEQQFTTDLWREQGPLLVLLCLPFIAFAFRRGVLLGVVALMLVPVPHADAGVLSDLWQRSDQQGASAFEDGDFDTAAELFEATEWRAAALYRAGKFEESASALSAIDTPDANYNRGNALAKAQDFNNAIKAYERTLTQAPDHEDAAFNLELLKQMQQEQQSQQQQQDQDSDESQDGQQQEQGESQEQNEGQDEGEPSESQNADQPSDEQQEAEQREAQTEEEREAERQRMEAQLAEQMSEEEQQQAVEQWLRRIPDDPGGLLRRKFKRQYRERGPAPRRTGDEW